MAAHALETARGQRFPNEPSLASLEASRGNSARGGAFDLGASLDEFVAKVFVHRRVARCGGGGEVVRPARKMVWSAHRITEGENVHASGSTECPCSNDRYGRSEGRRTESGRDRPRTHSFAWTLATPGSCTTSPFRCVSRPIQAVTAPSPARGTSQHLSFECSDMAEGARQAVASAFLATATTTTTTTTLRLEVFVEGRHGNLNNRGRRDGRECPMCSCAASSRAVGERSRRVACRQLRDFRQAANELIVARVVMVH